MRKLILHIFWTLLAFNLVQHLHAQEAGTATASCTFQVNYTIHHPTCVGDESGSIELEVYDAIGPVSYEWLDVDQANGTTTSEAVDALHAGLYRVRIADAICADTLNFTVVDPAPLEFDLITEAVTCIGDTDGTVTVETMTDGTIDTYSVDNGATSQTDNVFNNLGPGEHTIILTDLNGCVTEQSFFIEEPEEPEIDFEKNDVTCPGGNDASFIVIIETVSGLQEDYEYSLDGNVYQQSPEFNNLEAGEYETYAKNTSGCIFQEIVIISEPEERTVNYEKNDVTCPGGNDASFIVIIETVSGLQEDYEYSIDGSSYQADSIFYNLEAGEYEAFARNTAGCIFESPVLISIEEPEEPSLDFTKEDVSCPDGDDGSFIVIIETVSGLQEDYDYSLDSGMTYQADSTFDDLNAGIYEVMARNSSNCIFTIIVEITEPEASVYTLQSTDVDCAGANSGSITVGVVSGVAPHEFSTDGVNFQDSNVLENLSAGEYTVYVRDGNGCVSSGEITVEEPDPMGMQANGGNETCDYENGWASVAVEGGTSPYEYDWSNGRKTPAIADLSASMYHITITDLQGCQMIDSILIENLPAPEIEEALQHVSCNGDNDGWISLDVESESLPLEYIWSNGATREQSINLTAGVYSVTVIDDNNCYTSKQIEIEEPEALELEAAIGFAKSKGNINLEVSGGTPPYEYEWSDQSTEEDPEAIAYGVYTVTVTDAQGCTEEASFRVFDPSTPTEDHIKVYPVPTFTEVNIEIVLPEAEQVQIYLVDELGRVLRKSPETVIENDILTLNLEQLPAAIYLLRIHVGEEIVIKRIVKQTD